MTGMIRRAQYRSPGKIRRISAGAAAEAMLVLFYTLPFWKWVFEQIFELAGRETLALPVALCMVYVPVLVLFAVARQRIPVDFLFILFYLGMYLGITYLLHPEYE